MNNHMHSLNDDLESFIYVVLYAALRWLPVQSSEGRDLKVWLTTFFRAPNATFDHGGRDAKLANAFDRAYTWDLSSTESMEVIRWLNDAMDLHYKGGIPNPLWEDGKALEGDVGRMPGKRLAPR
jgi:hypothetical protein